MSKTKRIMVCILLAGIITAFVPSVFRSTYAEGVNVGVEARPSAVVVSSHDVLSMVTREYIQETVEQIMNFDAPLPVDRIKNCMDAWRLTSFSGFEEELRKLGADNESRIKFGARVLYAYDNPMILSHESGELFEDYVSREEIIDYVLTGKNKDVFSDDDGNPVMWMINMTDKMKKDFRKAFKKLEKCGIASLYDSIRDTGACVYFTAKLQSSKGAGAGLLVETGVINSNMDEGNTKGIDLTNMFGSILVVEPVGVAFCQVVEAFGLRTLDTMSGSKWVNYGELVKDTIAGYIVSCMDGGFSLLKEGFFSQADGYADKDGLSVKSAMSKRLIELILAAIEIPGEDLLNAAEE